MEDVRQRGLIINVDDIGIHEGAVEAAVETIVDGVAASGSLMTVCAGTPAALELLTARPEIPIGVHLTLIAEQAGVDWSPLTPGRSIQEDGRLLPIERRDQLLAQATIGDVEAEFRAQVEVMLEAGLLPTHLDWHCLADGGRDDIFDLTLALAQKYEIGVRAWTEHGRRALRTLGLPAQDQEFLDSFSLPVEGKQESVLTRIRALPEGLSEWAMHPARPHPADTGSDVRSTDYEVLMAESTRQVLQEEYIAVLGYGDPRFRTSR